MDEDRYEEEFNNAFPAELRKHAKACAVTGGEFIFEKMNFLEKAIVRKIGKVESTVSLIKEEKIEEFSNSFSKALV
jgi:menaquinone-dependent protoporphyrinogen oxidase